MTAIQTHPVSSIDTFARHQQRMIRQLERELGLTVHIRDDMLALVRTYAAITETGYLQLPFMLDKPVGVPSPHFWAHINDGPDIVAMAGLRVIANGDEGQTCGSLFAEGGLYPQQGDQVEPYLPESGPWLDASDRFGYLGAGWVHARWRGHALAGYLSRIIHAESAMRTPGLAFQSCLTFHPMFSAGLNLRANCWHHLRAEVVLEGHLAAIGKDVRMYMSHATEREQAELYGLELNYFDLGLMVPWLRPHDTTSAPAVFERHLQLATA